MNLAAEASPQCLVCGRAYAGTRSRPRWALDRTTGQLLGSVHTNCAVGRDVFTAEGDGPLETARFTLWRYYVARPDTGSDEWYAATLTDRGRDRALNAEQQELLEWWTTKGPLQLGADRVRGIVDAYHSSLERYADWRARVPEEIAA